MSISIDNFASQARSILAADRRATRGYDEMVAYLSLSTVSTSGEITEAARSMVLAAYPSTDPARLAGKDKSDDQRWKDARAARAGLVAAINRADDSEPEAKPVVLRASLSGEGGGSVTIEPGTEMYTALVAMIAEKSA